ncbi:MAG TPA: shikimate kinase [Acidimicrobiales bacterium]|nr:shikimate kinase [Acidimicrobiales bacterium]
MTARIVLVGAPGVGKTTIGRALAAALDVEFRDVDDLIATMSGEPCASLLRTQGEAAFRAAEASALATALADDAAGVVATGGGAVETASSRALLADEPLVIQLTASPAILLARLGDGDRPLLESPSLEGLIQLVERRAELYAEVADASVDASAPVEDVVATIVAIAVPA